MLYALSKFICRVLAGINHIHTFYMIREPAFADSLSRAPMADNEKGFPRTIPFARNPHDTTVPPWLTSDALKNAIISNYVYMN